MCYDELGGRALPAKGRIRWKTPWARGKIFTRISQLLYEPAADESGFSAVPDGFAGSAGRPVIQN